MVHAWSTVDFLLSWHKQDMHKVSGYIWKSILAVVWSVMWRETNARVFDNKKDNVVNLKLKCLFLLRFWCKITSADVLEPEALADFLSSLHSLWVLSFGCTSVQIFLKVGPLFTLKKRRKRAAMLFWFRCYCGSFSGVWYSAIKQCCI